MKLSNNGRRASVRSALRASCDFRAAAVPQLLL